MGYFSTWTERTESSARFLAPYTLMAVLFVFNNVSFSFPVTGSVEAPLLLMAIYYWAIYRPTLIPAWLVFTAGVLVDLLSGIPTVGLSALVFVAVQWLISDQRKFLMGQSFLMIWIGYLIVSFAASFVTWGVYGVMTGGWLPLKPVGLSILFGMAVFPLVCILLHLTHKVLPESRASFMLKTKKSRLS